MKTTLLATSLALIAATSPYAHAALVTRSMLIHACTAHDQRQLNDCAGYVAGVADMADSVQQGVCIPQGTKFDLLRKGVTTWLQSHTTSDGPAVPAVMGALHALYHCPG